MSASLYLIPCPITEDGTDTLSPRVADAVKLCQSFFVENLRSARRFLKKLHRDFDIDGMQWYVIGEPATTQAFRDAIIQGKTIGMISEAGCPGVADPGQDLIAIAQDKGIRVIPLVGPSSILLALMASGMNGQQFRFHGYLPIDATARTKALREIEADALRTGTTHIFIETPYRNDTIFSAILQTLNPNMRLCIAVSITGPEEWIRTMNCAAWKKQQVSLHKKTAIFLIGKPV